MTQDPFEIPQQLRGLAEKNVEQARVAYSQFMDAMTQAVGILKEKAPQLVEEYRQVVLQSAKDVAAAADDTSQKETAALGEIERALAM